MLDKHGTRGDCASVALKALMLALLRSWIHTNENYWWRVRKLGEMEKR
jgi:hypothetical protein